MLDCLLDFLLSPFYFSDTVPVFIQGTISVGIDATELFDHYDEDFEDVPGGGFPHIEINRMHISQSIEVNMNNDITV